MIGRLAHLNIYIENHKIDRVRGCDSFREERIYENIMKIANSALLAPYIPDYGKLTEYVNALRVLGQKIVLTQGTWDMFHTGHIRYLEEAKKAGDVLVVAVDSDRMTRERKGLNRPFDSEEERLTVLRALRSVDIVTFKDNNDDILDTLRAVRPDVFVISMSTGPEIQDHIEEFREFAKEVLNLPPQSSNSTTAKLQRLQSDVFGELETNIHELLSAFRRKINGEEDK